MILEIGSKVYGVNQTHCRVVGFIERGAFGELFKVISEDDGQAYALKAISPAFLKGDEPDALVNEGRMAPLINHPNVIRVYYFHDGYEHPKLPPYLIMEYADGGSLRDVLDNQRRAGIQFDRGRLEAMLAQLARGMTAVSKVLIHTDIKPDNILVRDGILKISDFGISRMISTAVGATTFRGMQQYMAPEAWMHQNATIQMDMYSMGVVFYELATLRHPYDASCRGQAITSWRDTHIHCPVVPPETINPELPLNIAQVIKRMLAKLPEDRYTAWSEIIYWLEV